MWEIHVTCANSKPINLSSQARTSDKDNSLTELNINTQWDMKALKKRSDSGLTLNAIHAEELDTNSEEITNFALSAPERNMNPTSDKDNKDSASKDNSEISKDKDLAISKDKDSEINKDLDNKDNSEINKDKDLEINKDKDSAIKESIKDSEINKDKVSEINKDSATNKD